MRYLGSKDSLLSHIKTLLKDKGLLNPTLNYTLFDGFCGMGSVSYGLYPYFNIVVNDILTCCVVFTKSRILSQKCNFEGLGFDPFNYLNTSTMIEKGFFYHNYTPGGSSRMYFTEYNGSRIDFFRSKIEEWRTSNLITPNEYTYLLGCLLESISATANVAGVYGAFLKHWDTRSKKKITIQPLSYNIDSGLFDNTLYQVGKTLDSYTERIENIIESVKCDILYLDPPYTQNQYGTQYHLLETLVLNDNPPISEITGSRPTTPLRSNWSKDIHCHILFDKIISKTTAKYIVMSYNNDGFMSKDYIESVLKRYGREDTFECRIIDYKKYNNFKCQGNKGHCEYLFFIEKKDTDTVVYESPMNYQGNKSDMIEIIKSHLPNDIDVFVDGFGGGFNVGVNIDSLYTIYNDINFFVKGIVEFMGKQDTYDNLMFIKRLIKKYNLSTENKEGYLSLREDYNRIPVKKRDPRVLYTLMMFGFQQQLRFNSSHEFNNPFGTRYFNEKLLSKFISFSRMSKEKEVTYLSVDYQQLLQLLTPNSVIYLDPPYRNSTGSYNDGKRGFNGWSKELEQSLCNFCNLLTSKHLKFLLSYNINEDIISWSNQHDYQVIYVSEPQGRYNKREEILIKNY